MVIDLFASSLRTCSVNLSSLYPSNFVQLRPQIPNGVSMSGFGTARKEICHQRKPCEETAIATRRGRMMPLKESLSHPNHFPLSCYSVTLEPRFHTDGPPSDISLVTDHAFRACTMDSPLACMVVNRDGIHFPREAHRNHPPTKSPIMYPYSFDSSIPHPSMMTCPMGMGMGTGMSMSMGMGMGMQQQRPLAPTYQHAQKPMMTHPNDTSSLNPSPSPYSHPFEMNSQFPLTQPNPAGITHGPALRRTLALPRLIELPRDMKLYNPLNAVEEHAFQPAEDAERAPGIYAGGREWWESDASMRPYVYGQQRYGPVRNSEEFLIYLLPNIGIFQGQSIFPNDFL